MIHYMTVHTFNTVDELRRKGSKEGGASMKVTTSTRFIPHFLHSLFTFLINSLKQVVMIRSQDMVRIRRIHMLRVHTVYYPWAVVLVGISCAISPFTTIVCHITMFWGCGRM